MILFIVIVYHYSAYLHVELHLSHDMMSQNNGLHSVYNYGNDKETIISFIK